MIGNLTCVLTKLDMLDSSLQVNLKLWTTDIWQPDLRPHQAGHAGLFPAGEPEAVDNGRLAADEPEEDPCWRGPRVEAEVDWRIHRLLPDCLQLAPAEPRQEPHHQGLWSPHDLLQVRHE